MSCSHMALVDSTKLSLHAGDDADDALWFELSCRLLNEHTDDHPDKAVKSRRILLELSHGEIELSCVIEEKCIRSLYDSSREYRIEENHGLAFDHGKIIFYALERLRAQLETEDLALHLMPEEFTLTQLQQVYEVILDRPLLKAAFRRKVAALVTETDSYTHNEGHRPSRLYRRRSSADLAGCCLLYTSWKSCSRFCSTDSVGWGWIKYGTFCRKRISMCWLRSQNICGSLRSSRSIFRTYMCIRDGSGIFQQPCLFH